MEEVRLYSIAVCPFAQRTRILLKLKGVPFQLTEIDITKPRPDWFLKLNPLGQVPVIEHRDIVLNESSVINEYLEEIFPQPAVFPSSPYRKARCRILIDYCNHEFVPAMYRLLMNQERSKDCGLTDKALGTWRWTNDFLLRHNSDGVYLFDEDGFGIAELSFAPFFMRYCLNEYYRYFQLPDGEAYARVRKWRDALLRHPLVIETGMPDEAFIKFYYDYSLGYGNGSVPEGHEQSSFNMAVSLSARPMPPRPIRTASRVGVRDLNCSVS